MPPPLPILRAKWLRNPGLQRLFAVIAESGGEARVAGGAVRNALMKLPVADIDIATTLPPRRVQEACEHAGFKAIPTGIAHGTVTVIVDHHPYEVTTLRADVATDGRRAIVAFHENWAADAARRDFTMNALYCDSKGRIYDFIGGYLDTLHQKVRFVGKPAQRIVEDYLRILRFFRFHAQFGKGAQDRAGLAACARAARQIDNLSAERIRQEMLKLLTAPGAVSTLKIMARGNILGHVLPYKEEWRMLQRLPPDPILRLAVLAAEPGNLKSRLRLSNEEAERLDRALAAIAPTPALRPAEQRHVLYHLGAETWRDAVHLAWAKSRVPVTDRDWKRLLALPGRWPLPRLPLTGDDLIAFGLRPGPHLGAELKRLEDWWIASDFQPDKPALLQQLSSRGQAP